MERGAPIDEAVRRALAAFAIDAAAPRASGTLGAELCAWTERVIAWNQKLDLTAARTSDELVDLLLADAAALCAALPPADGEQWVDVGSGAGAPGLALAVLAPAARFTLVEPKEKRTSFLRTMLGELGRSDVRIVRARSDTLASGEHDVAVSRATLPADEWLAEGARLARRAVWVLLAQHAPPAIAGWRPEREIAYAWPLTGAARRAVRYVPGTP